MPATRRSERLPSISSHLTTDHIAVVERFLNNNCIFLVDLKSESQITIYPRSVCSTLPVRKCKSTGQVLNAPAKFSMEVFAGVSADAEGREKKQLAVPECWSANASAGLL